MVRLLPALHEGHAPIHLHLAFEEALEAFEAWGLSAPEPEVTFEDRSVAISAIFGRMRTCSDILPQRLFDLAREVSGARADQIGDETTTYAQAALLLRALCVERLKQDDLER